LVVLTHVNEEAVIKEDEV